MRALSLRRAILFGWLSVATLDISDAFVFWYLRRGISPGRVLQGVAAGALGRDAALGGGIGAMILGAAAHLTVAFTVVAVYALASGRLPALRRRPFVFGPLYGVLVYGVMYYGVMPLSRIGWPAFSLVPFLNNVLIAHVCCVGIPTAWWASRIGAPPAAEDRLSPRA